LTITDYKKKKTLIYKIKIKLNYKARLIEEGTYGEMTGFKCEKKIYWELKLILSELIRVEKT